MSTADKPQRWRSNYAVYDEHYTRKQSLPKGKVRDRSRRPEANSLKPREFHTVLLIL